MMTEESKERKVVETYCLVRYVMRGVCVCGNHNLPKVKMLKQDEKRIKRMLKIYKK